MPFMAAVIPGLIAGAATAGVQGIATAVGNEAAKGAANSARQDFTNNLEAIKKRRMGGGGPANGGLGSGGLGGGFDTGGGQGDGRL